MVGSVNCTAQTLTDTTKQSLSLAELKIISKYLIELDMRRELAVQDSAIIDQQAQALNECTNINNTYKATVVSYEQKVDLLEEQVELVRPVWYDHFWIGVVTSVVVGAGILLVAK